MMPTTLEFLALRETETVCVILKDKEQELNRKHNIPQERSLCEITMESDEIRAVIRFEPSKEPHRTNYKIRNINYIVKLIERVYSTTEYKNNVTVLTNGKQTTIHIQYKP